MLTEEILRIYEEQVEQYKQALTIIAEIAAIKFDKFDFGEALKRLKAGKHVARDGWNGKGLWLEYVLPFGLKLAHIRLCYPDKSFVPWTPSQTDMLAEDWYDQIPE